MEDPTIEWTKSWKEFENELINNNWKKISDSSNFSGGCVNIPTYEKSGRVLDLSGNFGYVDIICITDKDKNLIKCVSREIFLEKEISFDENT